ncbi:hypothetical protein HZF24_10800 [Sedimentibacter hydroxybenzoicus DSM 7310]|uniref:Uncharacterized protein n=1 Tax=Sedimentibacter hydroxybenzoicus DSM 7310 TaxID=1123245 RepID=A0A974BKC8_SEDHY|nr:hypothetical protein [Sedimentibacter hydroxybenzoicus]NYB74623.1 hypothetical protein [Sedimentibacter hydroxybenzoicus DSM 7310]
MSEISTKVIELLEMLPENEQQFAFEFIKRLVLAWDPDYTKLTKSELESLEEALMDNSYVTHEELKKQLGI